MTAAPTLEQHRRLREILGHAVLTVTEEMRPGNDDEQTSLGGYIIAELINLAAALACGCMSEETFLTAVRIATGEVEWGEDAARAH